MRWDTCIIGGGIIGLCSAYYLQQEGQSVIIIDKGPSEKASSHGNCGFISPSHITPLNDWSLILKSLKWIFKEDAPFRIKPRFDLNLFKWFTGFALKANAKHVKWAMQGRHQILQSSKSLFEKMIEAEGIECNWSDEGVFLIYKEEKGFEEYSAINKDLEGWGLPADPYTGTDLLKKEPALREDVYGGWLYKTDSFIKPDLLVSALKKTLKEKGVQIIENFEVEQFELENGKVAAANGHSQSIEANSFVIATGAWTQNFTKQLNLNVPVVPGKGYSITMKPPKNMLSHSCIFEESKVAATPWKDTFRLGSLMEFTGFDDTINRVRLNALKTGAEPYLKTPYTDEIIEEWFGYRPMSMDGLPIIGKSPRHQNLFVATGHSMVGLSMGTGTGKLISELVCEKSTHMDPSFYSMNRF